MSEIRLLNRAGEIIGVTQVDACDMALFGDLRWYRHQSDTNQYAVRQAGHVRWFLHRAILGLAPDDPRLVDHVNGDTLDNRRANLRIATTAENAQNQGSRGGRSRFRGVAWDASRDKWIATATLNGRRTTVGRFDTEDEAGAAVAAWRRDHMPFAQEAA